LFLRVPWPVIVIIAIGVFAMRYYARTDAFNDWYWYWTGLSAINPVSSDYVPVFPWFSAPLMGIAFAKVCEQMNWWPHLSRPRFNGFPGRLLKFMGQNSLLYYLLHQPVMIGLMLGILWIGGNL